MNVEEVPLLDQAFLTGNQKECLDDCCGRQRQGKCMQRQEYPAKHVDLLPVEKESISALQNLRWLHLRVRINGKMADEE